jgi:pathogenesis-related protein 1
MYVRGDMRPKFRRLFVLAAAVGLAGSAVGQWRHFGENVASAETPGAAAPLEAKPAPSLPYVSSRSPMVREIVDAHNVVRARVGTAPLVWSDRLAGVAQEWANRLMANGQFAHSHNPNYGENLYEISGAAATPNQVVKAFADEVVDYDYRTNTCRERGVCGHYTQVVWNDTKEVGCAVARGGRREVWVCEYYPPGNWVGRKPY